MVISVRLRGACLRIGVLLACVACLFGAREAAAASWQIQPAPAPSRPFGAPRGGILHVRRGLRCGWMETAAQRQVSVAASRRMERVYLACAADAQARWGA